MSRNKRKNKNNKGATPPKEVQTKEVVMEETTDQQPVKQEAETPVEPVQKPVVEEVKEETPTEEAQPPTEPTPEPVAQKPSQTPPAELIALAQKINLADPSNPLTMDDMGYYAQHTETVDKLVVDIVKQRSEEITHAEQAPSQENLTEIQGTFERPLKTVYGEGFNPDKPQFPASEQGGVSPVEPIEGNQTPSKVSGDSNAITGERGAVDINKQQGEQEVYTQEELMADMYNILGFLYRVHTILDDPEKELKKGDVTHLAIKSTLEAHQYVPPPLPERMLPENLPQTAEPRPEEKPA